MNMNCPPAPCSTMSGQRVITKVWTTAGTFPYQPSPGLISLIVECVGGGGGGGGTIATLATPTGAGWISGGGGGASGGYSRKSLSAADVLAGAVVTVAAGGLGGTAAPGGGGPGGATSFGTLCVANGGNGGVANGAAGDWGLGGGVAAIGLGDVASVGNAGQQGGAFYADFSNNELVNSIVIGGLGGESFFGGRRTSTWCKPGGSDPASGTVPAATGSGGGGGCSGLSTLPAIGEAGGDGVCVVTEYCWADESDCGVQPGFARVAAMPEPWPSRGGYPGPRDEDYG